MFIEYLNISGNSPFYIQICFLYEFIHLNLILQKLLSKFNNEELQFIYNVLFVGVNKIKTKNMLLSKNEI